MFDIPLMFSRTSFHSLAATTDCDCFASVATSWRSEFLLVACLRVPFVFFFGSRQTGRATRSSRIACRVCNHVCAISLVVHHEKVPSELHDCS